MMAHLINLIGVPISRNELSLVTRTTLFLVLQIIFLNKTPDIFAGLFESGDCAMGKCFHPTLEPRSLVVNNG